MRQRQKREAKVLAWLILSLGVILAVLAINFDGGRLLEERRRAQTVAESAGLAAAEALYKDYWTCHGTDPAGTARAAAVALAEANGLPVSAVSVHVPPTSGAFAGQSGYVEVLIDSKLEATFGRAITRDDLTARGRSVVRGKPMALGILTLRSSGADAFLNDSPAFTVINAPLVVNSRDPAAFRQQSFGVFVASKVRLSGGMVNPGGALMLGCVKSGLRPALDPLQFLPIPDTSAPVRSVAPLTINSLVPRILHPGVYRGGLRVTGASVVTMLPGVYIMEGGGFVVDGLATLVALEVMVYNTNSTTHAAGSIRVTSLGKVVMAAPLSGTYQGINFFQNRSLTNPVTMRGGGLTAITGTIYAPRAPATLHGLAAVGLDILGGAYVVDSMSVQGAGAINIDLKLNPPRIPDIRRVE